MFRRPPIQHITILVEFNLVLITKQRNSILYSDKYKSSMGNICTDLAIDRHSLNELNV